MILPHFRGEVKDMERVLGIDVGTNSVGWALVRLDDNPCVEGMGVRIFHEAVEPKDRKPKNAARRAKRMLRRQIRRRAQRRRAITAICQRYGLLPTNPIELHALLCDEARNPFRLRAKALDERLDLEELGKVFLHLGAHRGYKSNRKALLSKALSDPDLRQAASEFEEDRKRRAAARSSRRNSPEEDALDEEEGRVLQAIAQLEQEMKESGSRTLGEHLARVLAAGGKARRGSSETANYTREMVEAEFEAIWEAQARFHPVLNDRLQALLHRAIFFQRPLKVRRRGVERCPFEPFRNRAFKAQVIGQTFRAWQQALSLKWKPAGSREDFRQLDIDQVRLVAQHLLENAELSFSQLRKLLGHPRDAEYNLALGGRKTLSGSETSVRLRRILGDAWDRMDELEKDRLVHELVHSESMDSLANRLRKAWGFDPKTVYRLITTELPTGTASLSAKAMRKLLPLMQAGKRYDEACMEVYGRLGPKLEENLEAQLVPMPTEGANPVVHRALVEVRRIVNAVIREYGKPDRVHVEATRELKLRKADREKLQRQQRDNERDNREATQEFVRLHPGREPRRADLEKYRLWKESGGLCPYTGRCIPLEMLWTAEVDVEHIIPLPRCWDDSFRNKTLCMAAENQRKGNRTPREAYSPDELAVILERLEKHTSMPFGKRRLFQIEWNDQKADDFLNRQLRDTSLATTLARRMLVPIFGDTNVLCLPGRLTAFLRHHWGLQTVLGSETKNREDHRHHAVDAVVIALTSRSLLQRAATFAAKHGHENLDHAIKSEAPIPDVRDQVVRLIDQVVVSHQTTRRARGGFVEDTAYGKVQPGMYLYRKPIGSLSDGEIAKVRDPGLRKRLEAVGSTALQKRAKEDPNKPFTYLDRYGRERVVRSVRLLVRASDRSMVPVGPSHYASAANHHVAVFEVNGERRYVVVSLFEVYRRLREKLPVYDRHALPGGRFLFAWHANDTVVVEGRPEKYYRIASFSDDDPEGHRKIDMELWPVNRAVGSESRRAPNKAAPFETLRCKSPSTLRLVSGPVSVDALGRVR